MKFYTLDNWIEDQNLDDAQVPNRALQAKHRYRNHLSKIQKLLPTQLRHFSEKVNIHDGYLCRLTVDPERGDVVAIYRAATAKQMRPIQVKLTYSGVRSVLFASTAKKGLPGPYGFGDLGHDEIDVLGPRLFEHALLFSSGIELRIRFQDFSFKKVLSTRLPRSQPSRRPSSPV